MIELSSLQFAVFIQVIIVLVTGIILLCLFWSLERKRAKQNFIKQIEEIKSKQVDPRQYLTQEEKICRGHVEALSYGEKDSSEEALVLKFRADILKLEKELVALNERDNKFWHRVYGNLKDLFSAYDLYGRFSLSSDEEVLEVRRMLDQQQENFQGLLGNIDEDKPEAAKANLEAILQNHRELSTCVLMLEEQVHFLREQISALLNHT